MLERFFTSVLESVSTDVIIACILILFGLLSGSFFISPSQQQQKKFVSKILIHPIKSCRGTSVDVAQYTPHGLENDRKFVIIDAATHVTITARDIPKMILIDPTIFSDPLAPHGGHLSVLFPQDSECPSFVIPLYPSQEILGQWKLIHDLKIWSSITDGYVCESLVKGHPSPSNVLSNFLGRPVHLVIKGPTRRPLEPTANFPSLDGSAVFQDGYPLLITSTSSLHDVQQHTWATAKRENTWDIKGVDSHWKEEELTMERFRPNLVISGTSPFEEDTWEEIAVGESGSKVTCVSKCTRCQLPNIDPITGIQDSAVPYKVLAKYRRVDSAHKYTPCFGVNAVPTGNGIFRVGDEVAVLKHIK